MQTHAVFKQPLNSKEVQMNVFMVSLATVLQGELKTAVEILALFHLSITTMPIQPRLAPQAEHSQ